MRVREARDQVVALLRGDVQLTGPSLDERSPDSDEGKFMLAGRVARAIHHFDGWYVPIDLDWFNGGFELPAINRSPFYWYVFAIPGRRPWTRPHYLVCDYLQIRDWVLDFAAPLGRDHRNHRNWRADIRAFAGDPGETMAYFRWGDEPIEHEPHPSRVVELDNGVTIGDPVALKAGLHVGTYGRGGESAAHKRLKLYVAAHPDRFGLSSLASPHIEYGFLSGDKVDVLFENHQPHRTVVEVEVAGEQNVLIGVHQAIKYRSLAEVDAGYTLLSADVRSLVVAYDTDYPRVIDLAGRYNVDLQSVDRSLVLATS